MKLGLPIGLDIFTVGSCGNLQRRCRERKCGVFVAKLNDGLEVVAMIRFAMKSP